MDYVDHPYFIRISGWISKGIRPLSERVSEKVRPYIPKALLKRLSRWKEFVPTVVFILGSIAIGLLASQWSERDAVLKWEKAHFPNFNNLNALISPYGYREFTHSEQLEGIMSRIPSEMESARFLWASSDFEWLFYGVLDGTTLESHVFCKQCEFPPESWELQGVGWVGLQRLLESVEKIPTDRKTLSTQSKKAPQARDPREIVY